MDQRNFHTAFLGGFRKKDVVNFLAEDKRRQEESLQELNAQLDEASEQIKQLMEQRDNALEQVQVLCAQREELQAALEAAQTEREMLETKLTEAERLCGQKETELKEAFLRRDEACSRVTELETDLEESQLCSKHLEAQLKEAKTVNRFGLDLPGEVPGTGALAKEVQSLREQLQAERLRAEALDARLREQPQTMGSAQSADQLWNLCGKMERTLRQMERMLDGPYRMTCYPEPMEQMQEAAEPVMQEEAFEPVAEQPAPVQAPSVKNLLQRVRIKR